MVISRSQRYVDTSGQSIALTAAMRTELEGVVTDMAKSGLRTLCLSYRDFTAQEVASYGPDFFEKPPEDDLTALCIVGIKVRHARLRFTTMKQPCTWAVGRFADGWACQRQDRLIYVFFT